MGRKEVYRNANSSGSSDHLGAIEAVAKGETEGGWDGCGDKKRERGRERREEEGEM